VIAWFSQRGYFGPTNGAVSDRYPTLIVAAGYAFSIWGVIFLLDLIFAVWQLRRHPHDSVVQRIRPAVALGFGLTASWMIVFSQQWFWLSLAIIWLALACLLGSVTLLSRADPAGRHALAARLPLSLHAGWLSLAAFLNLAQVIVAFRLLPTDQMLGWSAVLLAIAGVLLLVFNHLMHGNIGFGAAAVWGLAGVYVKQSASALPGADQMAWFAAGLALALIVQTMWLVLRRASAAHRAALAATTVRSAPPPFSAPRRVS
jgi:hypothetical protein